MRKPSIYNIRGYYRLLRLLALRTWSFLYLFLYTLVIGVISLAVYVYKCIKWAVNTHPKFLLAIVCIAFIVEHFRLGVYYSLKAQEQNTRFDSLAALKDSIQMYSSYDSGYAVGLRDGNMMRTDNGFQREESIVP